MRSPIETLATLPPNELAAALAKLTEAEARAMLYDWRGWHARPEQLAPVGEWDIWLVLAGRGWGKTKTGAEWVREEVAAGRAGKIALVAETAADARDVMVSALRAVFPPDKAPIYTKSNRCVEFHNGAKAWTYNATEPDQLRGPQHDLSWCDELCLVAGTMVETGAGPRPIEALRPGDMVWTRRGLRRVARAWRSSPAAEVWRLRTLAGRDLVGTAGHPVFVHGKGFVPLRALRNGDTVSAWETNTSNGVANAGIATVAATTRAERASSTIVSFTRTITANCRQTWMFTIGMVTRATMRFLTSWRSPEPSICGSTARGDSSYGGQRSGAAIRQRTSGGSASLFSASAHTAGGGSSRSGCGQNTARPPANRRRSMPETPDTTTDSVASVLPLPERRAVYNIEVEGEHEYFANGILTHNCKWRYARETWDMLQFGLRLGHHPRQIVTTTPRPIEVVKAIVAGQEGKVAITRGSTLDNRSNLAASFLDRVVKRYEGTRLGRQELNAEILGDLPGALWSQASLDTYRVRSAPELSRVLVSVDPAVTVTENSDQHGIVVAGVASDQTAYVVEDASMSGTPREWASRAISLYRSHCADGIVVEVNQGGDMVAHTLRTVDPDVNIIEVRATRGKHVRAEPIAALYEQGRIRHVGQFPELESQMTQFTAEGYQGEDSPDRADAMVWAMTELFPGMVDRVPDASRFAIPRAAGGWMAS